MDSTEIRFVLELNRMSTLAAFLLQHGYLFIKNIHHNDVGTRIDLVQRKTDGRLFVAKVGSHRKTLDYEAMIASQLFGFSCTHNIPIVPEFIETLDDGEQVYLILEYVQGETASAVLYQRWDTYDENLQKLLCSRFVELLRKLRRLESLTGFTHYDLHLGNIITNDNLKTFKIIDFETSHLPGRSGWARLTDGALMIGAVPSISDPWFDLVRLVVTFYSRMGRPLPFDVKRRLDRAGFNTATTRQEIEKNLAKADRLNGEERLVAYSQLYPGSQRMLGSRLILAAPETTWKDGFWVTDQDISGLDSRAGFDTKVSFGEFLAYLKFASFRRGKSDSSGPVETPDHLIERVRDDLLVPSGPGVFHAFDPKNPSDTKA